VAVQSANVRWRCAAPCCIQRESRSRSRVRERGLRLVFLCISCIVIYRVICTRTGIQPLPLHTSAVVKPIILPGAIHADTLTLYNTGTVWCFCA